MIPKRAFFFWGGPGEMSWLRRQSIVTFMRLNPDWAVDVFHRPGFNPVHRSDLFRYQELTRGGVYFDTDIVFIRQFPEHLLDCDVGITISDRWRFCNIGVLLSSGSSRLFSEAKARAVERSSSESYRESEYQTLGVGLLNSMHLGELRMSPVIEKVCQDAFRRVASCYHGEKWINLPESLICPVPWTAVKRLYDGTHVELGMDTIGVHWFGGNDLSKDFELSVNSSTDECLMTRVLSSAEVETFV